MIAMVLLQKRVCLMRLTEKSCLMLLTDGCSTLPEYSLKFTCKQLAKNRVVDLRRISCQRRWLLAPYNLSLEVVRSLEEGKLCS